MPPSRISLRGVAVLLLALANAQQQQLQHDRSSHHELPDVGLLTHDRVSKSERAVATLAPAAFDAVRAPPTAKSAAGPDSRGAISSGPPRARSLRDWEVENFVLLATVDGSIYARDRSTGNELWEFHSERPMVETVYHDRKGNPEDKNWTWIVEPDQDGSLYVFVRGLNQGIQKLGPTVRELAENLSPWVSEDSPFVYTAEKRNTLFTLNATNGAALKYFSAGSSGVIEGVSCRNVKALEMGNEECEPTPTINIGRMEYVVGIQDKDTGEGICTIKYFEWTPNIRDRDLQAQYTATMDKKYIYTGYDGSIVGLDQIPDRRKDGRILYQQKLKSPVARIFDVARPQGADSRDIPLVLLPQPVAPVRHLDLADNLFVNCTESGSWYALSESKYPSVTHGASDAKCYDSSIEGEPSAPDAAFNAEDLVGVHQLSEHASRRQNVPLIGGHEHLMPTSPTENPHPATTGEAPQNVTEDRLLIDAPPAWYLKFSLKHFGVLLLALLVLPMAIQSMNRSLARPEAYGVKEIIPEKTAPERAEPTLEPENVDEAPQPEPDQVKEAVVEIAEPAGPAVAGAEQADGEQDDGDDGDQAGDGLDAAEPGAADAPRKKKAHRGNRGRGTRGNKKKKQQSGDANQEKDGEAGLEKFVDDALHRAHVLLPDQDEDLESSVTDVSGSVRLNDLIVHTDKILGHGSGGTTVYEGKFGSIDVAVKRMLLAYFDLAAQEVALLQQSDHHRSIIRYFHQQKDRNFLYIAVEKCQASLWDLYKDGGSRDNLCEKHVALVDEINLNIPAALKQLASGLCHLHSLRIIHRDIKPQNILIAYPRKNEKDVRLVISDFGLCRTLPENVSTLIGTIGGNAGTVGWKAPELIGQPRNAEGRQSSTTGEQSSTISNEAASQGVKRAVDIFSLGCVFFYLLTNGSHPFDNEQSELWHIEREYNIKKGKPNFGKLTDLGDDAAEPLHLIEWMLSPRPEDRCVLQFNGVNRPLTLQTVSAAGQPAPVLLDAQAAPRVPLRCVGSLGARAARAAVGQPRDARVLGRRRAPRRLPAQTGPEVHRHARQAAQVHGRPHAGPAAGSAQQEEPLRGHAGRRQGEGRGAAGRVLEVLDR
jgi:serine/threonine-protein kinase/endoribonuclease IRE1